LNAAIKQPVTDRYRVGIERGQKPFGFTAARLHRRLNGAGINDATPRQAGIQQ
jgi:hypothetical protein